MFLFFFSSQDVLVSENESSDHKEILANVVLLKPETEHSPRSSSPLNLITPINDSGPAIDQSLSVIDTDDEERHNKTQRKR